MIGIVDDEHFIDPDISGEKPIGGLDGVFGNGALFFGFELGAGRHHLGDAFCFVAILDDITGEEAGELTGGVDDGEGGEGEALCFDHGEHVADELFRCDGDGILNQAMDVAFDASDLLHLVLRGHIIMDEPETAVEGHGDGHARLGDGVHIGRDDGNLQAQALAQGGGGIGVLGQDIRVEGGERDVVKGECRG